MVGEEEEKLDTPHEDGHEEASTTVDPMEMTTTTTTTLPPRGRVFSILSHQYCDQDTKPVLWRSCPSSMASPTTADC